MKNSGTVHCGDTSHEPVLNLLQHDHFIKKKKATQSLITTHHLVIHVETFGDVSFATVPRHENQCFHSKGLSVCLQKLEHFHFTKKSGQSMHTNQVISCEMFEQHVFT